MSRYNIYINANINYQSNDDHEIFLNDLHSEKLINLLGDGHPRDGTTDLDFSVGGRDIDDAKDTLSIFYGGYQLKNPTVLLKYKFI